ncbi:MAG: PIN domain-containing protein [Gammaproteobacteria bacterium]|nr:PIN domain-containing protein [Gammaproteobacteria bacterium]MDE0302328.1 PIN domain-containing protein [Gammaproteobacteria bacterium]
MDTQIIHLDTSFLARAVHAGSHESEKIKSWLRSGEVLSMSTVAWAEYLCGGPETDEDLSLANQVVPNRVDFTEEMASLSARLFNETGRRRSMLRDCMIAATAITKRARIATANLKDFQKFERFGLVLAPTEHH